MSIQTSSKFHMISTSEVKSAWATIWELMMEKKLMREAILQANAEIRRGFKYIESIMQDVGTTLTTWTRCSQYLM